MKLITEVSEDIKYFAEEKDGKRSLFIEGVFLQSNLKNQMVDVPQRDHAKRGRSVQIGGIDKAYGRVGTPRRDNSKP